MIHIDINSDVGEGIGNESELMPFLSSCNIACGGHAGNDKTMMEVLAFAKANNVKIGAHPSYPDKKNFGRKIIDISKVNLKQSIKNQIKRLRQLAEINGQKVYHIKPHGALYNLAAINKEIAMLVVESVLEVDDSLLLFTPYNSVVFEIAKDRLDTVIEGFADRAYHKDYTLVSREEIGAVLDNPKDVINQVVSIVKNKELTTLEGVNITFEADTFCIHSDTPNALVIASKLKQALNAEGFSI